MNRARQAPRPFARTETTRLGFGTCLCPMSTMHRASRAPTDAQASGAGERLIPPGAPGHGGDRPGPHLELGHSQTARTAVRRLGRPRRGPDPFVVARVQRQPVQRGRVEDIEVLPGVPPAGSGRWPTPERSASSSSPTSTTSTATPAPAGTRRLNALRHRRRSPGPTATHARRRPPRRARAAPPASAEAPTIAWISQPSQDGRHAGHLNDLASTCLTSSGRMSDRRSTLAT